MGLAGLLRAMNQIQATLVFPGAILAADRRIQDTGESRYRAIAGRITRCSVSNKIIICFFAEIRKIGHVTLP